MISIADARAPFVMFEQRAEEDRNASIEAGSYKTKDVDYALITPQGSKDRVERVVSEWFEHLQNEVVSKRFPGEWLKAFKFAYSEWKEGREIPVNGTAIVNWSVLSPSQVATLRGLKILTVEAVAEANEETVNRIGMGGRALKQLAVDFLAGSEKGSAQKIAVELNALRAKLETMEKTNSQLLEANQMLQRDVANSKQEPSPPENRPITSASDLLEDRPAPQVRKVL